MQQNCIREISHAAGVRNLDTLNISHNRLKRVDNLDQLPMLTNINLAHNFIGTKEDIAGLLQCPTLRCRAGGVAAGGVCCAERPTERHLTVAALLLPQRDSPEQQQDRGPRLPGDLQEDA